MAASSSVRVRSASTTEPFQDAIRPDIPPGAGRADLRTGQGPRLRQSHRHPYRQAGGRVPAGRHHGHFINNVSCCGTARGWVVIDGERLPAGHTPGGGSIPRPERGAIHQEASHGPYGYYCEGRNNNVFSRLTTHDNYESGFQLQGARLRNNVDDGYDAAPAVNQPAHRPD
ncbi:hypothetical protein ACIHCQ_30970 [Streptomyces sp. NPDC052236]|uniref:hypothetical protein n=1 Tax=Streptomyces sp. NPDC052236 TaxID=3365686 RepID=UPI0037D3ACF1